MKLAESLRTLSELSDSNREIGQLASGPSGGAEHGWFKESGKKLLKDTKLAAIDLIMQANRSGQSALADSAGKALACMGDIVRGVCIDGPVMRSIASRLEQLAAIPASSPHPTNPKPSDQATVAKLGDAFLCESDLVEKFGVNRNTLRKNLVGWRRSHNNNDWIRTPNPRPRDPRFLYRISSVMPLIEALRNTGE